MLRPGKGKQEMIKAIWTIISYRVNPGIEGVSDKKLAFAPGGRVCCSGAEGKRGAKAQKMKGGDERENSGNRLIH